MKTLYIHCDGGFGNRFNTLIVGLQIARIGNFNPIISWAYTNSCRASFDDIFENKFKVVPSRLEEYSDSFSEYELIMHENQLNWNAQIRSPYSFSTIDQIVSHYNNSTKDSLFYFNNLIPNYSDLNLSLISELQFKKKYYETVKNFLPDNNYIGVHLRSTDFPQGSINFDEIYQKIKISDKKHFVCSDSLDVENKFNQLDNVFTFPKTSYVKKINPHKGWSVPKGQIKDEVGKPIAFNVERSSESVMQSIIDLLILSKSDIMLTSDSTFLSTAILLKKYKNYEINIK